MFWLQTLRNWKRRTHRKFIYPRRINAERSNDATKGRIFHIPNSRWEETTNSENEDLSGELHGESEGPQPTETKDDAEARKDKVTSSIVVTMILEFNSMCRKKKHSVLH